MVGPAAGTAARGDRRARLDARGDVHPGLGWPLDLPTCQWRTDHRPRPVSGRQGAARRLRAAGAGDRGPGYLVAIVPVPFNLAVFDIDAAQRVITEHPEIDRWAVGGHSLGGSMAAQFLSSHQGAIEGLVLWASYSAADISAPASPWPRRTGRWTLAWRRTRARRTSPSSARPCTFTPIEGGNHEQMGWYTGQPNDPPAAISREAQQQAVVAATLDLLQALR